MWQGGRQQRQGWVGMLLRPRGRAGACLWERVPCSGRYEVVTVLAARGAAVSVELIYHKWSGKSRGNHASGPVVWNPMSARWRADPRLRWPIWFPAHPVALAVAPALGGLCPSALSCVVCWLPGMHARGHPSPSRAAARPTARMQRRVISCWAPSRICYEMGATACRSREHV